MACVKQRFLRLVHVSALDAQAERLLRAEVRSGRPYLNVGCDDLPGGDFRLPLMGEYRQVVSRALRIELPAGDAEPAQGQRAVLEDRIVSEADAPSLRVNLFERHEEIQIVRLIRRHEQID